MSISPWGQFSSGALDCGTVGGMLASSAQSVNGALVFAAGACSGSWSSVGDVVTVALSSFYRSSGAAVGSSAPEVSLAVVNPSLFDLSISSALPIAGGVFGLLVVAFVFRIIIQAMRDEDGDA